MDACTHILFGTCLGEELLAIYQFRVILLAKYK